MHIPVVFGWLWLTVVNCGQLWLTVVDRGRPWSTTTHPSPPHPQNCQTSSIASAKVDKFGQKWLTWTVANCIALLLMFFCLFRGVVDCGRLWLTAVDHNRPQSTTINHTQPNPTKVTTTSPDANCDVSGATLQQIDMRHVSWGWIMVRTMHSNWGNHPPKIGGLCGFPQFLTPFCEVSQVVSKFIVYYS